MFCVLMALPPMVIVAGVVLRSPHSPIIAQPAAFRIRMRVSVAEPDAVRSLASMIGDRDAKRIMQTHGISARLADGSLLDAIPRLREEFGVSGDGLATFISGSVAARLDDEAFWAGLARLGELGISGDGLVTFMSDGVAARLEDEAFWAGLARLRDEFGIAGDGLVTFMSNSVAARLDNRDFMDGLSSLCAGLSPPVVIGLLNDGLASRLTAEYARSILSITRHLDSHGLDGAKRLKTLLGKSPLVGKLPELEALLLSADSRDAIEGVLQRFRGSYAHKRAMAATL